LKLSILKLLLQDIQANKGGDKQKPKVAALLKLLSAQQRSLDVSCSRRGLLL